MKVSSSVYTYLSALIIGVLLTIFSNQTDLYHWLVIVIGILFLVPSAILMLTTMFAKKDAEGKSVAKPWYIAAIALAGMLFGIWMLVMPGYFIGGAVYTFGVILVLVGIAATVFTATANVRVKMKKLWYLVPWVCIIVGFVIIFMGPARIGHYVNLLTGILLIVYAINGFFCTGNAKIRDNRNTRLIEKSQEEQPKDVDSEA